MIEPRAPRPVDGAAVAETGDRLPEQFGPFLLVRTIGSGGMGNVYLTRTPWDDRPVAALKRMRIADSLLEERFRHEAALTVRLEHRNLIVTYDVGAVGDQLYVCSELIVGRDLGAITQWLLQGGRGCSIAMAYGVLIDVLSALAYIHKASDIDGTPLKLIHRDIKPANIIVGYDGIARVADFGAAKSLLTADLELTAPGTLVATPSSIAPELLRGEPASPASDIYSLGSSIYRLLTGVPPHPGKSVKQVLMSVLLETPRPLSSYRTDLPTWFSELIHQMLIKDQHVRPGSAEQILEWAAVRAKESGIPPPQPATARWLTTTFAADYAAAIAERDRVAHMGREHLAEFDEETRVFASSPSVVGRVKTDAFDIRTEVGMPRLDAPAAIAEDTLEPGEFEVETKVDRLPSSNPRGPATDPVGPVTAPVGAVTSPVVLDEERQEFADHTVKEDAGRFQPLAHEPSIIVARPDFGSRLGKGEPPADASRSRPTSQRPRPAPETMPVEMVPSPRALPAAALEVPAPAPPSPVVPVNDLLPLPRPETDLAALLPPDPATPHDMLMPLPLMPESLADTGPVPPASASAAPAPPPVGSASVLRVSVPQATSPQPAASLPVQISPAPAPPRPASVARAPQRVSRILRAVGVVALALALGFAIGAMVEHRARPQPSARSLPAELTRAREVLRQRAQRGQPIPQDAWLELDASWEAVSLGEEVEARRHLERLVRLLPESADHNP